MTIKKQLYFFGIEVPLVAIPAIFSSSSFISVNNLSPSYFFLNFPVRGRSQSGGGVEKSNQGSLRESQSINQFQVVLDFPQWLEKFFPKKTNKRSEIGAKPLFT